VQGQQPIPVISSTSREALLHLLAEAAELEHNLLCSYLFAAFSLKHGTDEGLGDGELEPVCRWRGTLMDVCIEEMVHLAQVGNLMSALGARPHFNRPNLPVAPGYHPSGIVVELAPFSAETLQHFIFLERSDEVRIDDSVEEAPDSGGRGGVAGGLMPSAPDYATIGEFYESLQRALAQAAEGLGEQRLFLAAQRSTQLRPQEIRAPELRVVTDMESARAAIELIVTQGEGHRGPGSDDSHFAKFQAMQREYERLCRDRPGFEPARPVGRNPVMRAPVTAGRLHVTASLAREVLDAFNGTYALMWRALTAVWDTPWDESEVRQALLGCAFGAMQLLGILGEQLTRLPASDDLPGVHAGPSFTMPRSTEGWLAGADVRALLDERAAEIQARVRCLPLRVPEAAVRAACRLRSLNG
jgi:hypothetical protein